MQTLKGRARLFSALGDPVRLKVLDALCRCKACICICHLAKAADRDQSVIFRHVQILHEAGLVKTRKDGKFLLCCATKEARKFVEG